MNYLNIKLAIRNLTRQKFYTILNITGLSFGMALVIFIGLYLYQQFSYDKFKGHERIFRVEMGEWAILGPVYARLVGNSSANVEQTLRIDSNWGHNAKLKPANEDKALIITYVVLADHEIFDFFPLTFIEGSSENSLLDKNSIVMTRSQAMRFFGKTNIVGEAVRLNDNYLLTVTGVIEDIKLLHFKADAIASFELFGDIYSPDFFERTDGWNHNTYVKLHPNADVAATESAIHKTITDHIEKLFGVNFENQARLRPVGDIYFTSEKLHEIQIVHGDKNRSYAFLIIAVFILFIAVINFVNLATARSARRARETGISKLLGSTRIRLIYQYMLESVFITFIAVGLAFAIIEILLPWFNYLTDSDNSLRDLSWWKWAAGVLATSLFIGFLAGAYPSFYLSGFQPARVLKGDMVRGKGAAIFRKILIVFQFTISVALVAGTIIVYQQLNHLTETDTGFKKEGIIYFTLNPQIMRGWEGFRNELLQHPGVESVALSNAVPGRVRWQQSIVRDEAGFKFTYWPMTPEYFDMLGLELLAGREFSRSFPADVNQAVIVNEQWIWNSGIDFTSYDEIPGQFINNTYRIIGVVKDFHYNSLHNAIGPLMMIWHNHSTRIASIRINPAVAATAIAHIEETWNTSSPDEIFTYNYLKDSFEKLYENEQRMGMIFISFSSFAVVIAFMGLFAITSFMIEKRTREISIRMVMGATPLQWVIM
jgi:putative ABC transport system permease protein